MDCRLLAVMNSSILTVHTDFSAFVESKWSNYGKQRLQYFPTTKSQHESMQLAYGWIVLCYNARFLKLYRHTLDTHTLQ